MPGGGSLHPGGKHNTRVQRALRELSKGSVAAAAYLNRVIAGEETTTVMTRDGAETIPVPAKERIAAALGSLKLVLPKKLEIKDDQQDEAARQLAQRLVARLAGLDS